MYFTVKLIAIIILAGFVGACCGVSIKNYEPKPIDHDSNSQERRGLKIYIDPLTTRKDCKKFFGVNLLNLGILPVFVLAENSNPSSSFIIKNDQFSLSNVEWNSPDRSKVGDESTLVLVNNCLMGSLPVISMIRNKLEIKQNFAEKEFRAKTLSPGEQTHGYVYFQLPKQGMTEDCLSIQVKAFDIENKEWEKFNIRIE